MWPAPGSSAAPLLPPSALPAGLVAYSIAVTLYAAQAGRSASTAASAGSTSSVSGTIDPPLEGLETVAGAAEADAGAPQSFAEAVAATSVADLAQPPSAELERKLQKARAAAAASAAPAAPKKEDRVVCKVCGGSGQVSYENHMTSADGTICPCCLVSPARGRAAARAPASQHMEGFLGPAWRGVGGVHGTLSPRSICSMAAAARMACCVRLGCSRHCCPSCSLQPLQIAWQ